MNKNTHSAFKFYQYMKVTRDILGYAFGNPNLKYQEFEDRRNFFEDSLKEGQPLYNVLMSNGENGQKVLEKINEFIDEVFHTSIITKNGEFVRFDKVQSMNFLNAVIGVREIFFDIVNSHMNYLKENDILESEFANLVEAEDNFYRSVAIAILNDNLKDKFIEYNKYMNESKGERTPQSNFVGNMLGTFMGLTRFVISRKKYENAEFNALEDAAVRQIELMEGKYQVKSAQEREDVFVDCKALGDKAIYENEKKWVELFVPFVKELLEFEKQFANNN